MAKQAVNRARELEALTLLVNYRQTVSFEEALSLFEEKYDSEFSEDIKKATREANINDGQGITTFSQAKQLLEDTKFIDNKTIYKKIGLITGIDPEYFEEFRIDSDKLPTTALENIKNYFSRRVSRSQDILYKNVSLIQRASDYTISNLSYLDAASQRSSFEPIFLQYYIMQYLTEKGWYLNKRDGGYPGDRFIDLTNKLLVILQDFTKTTYAPEADERTQQFQNKQIDSIQEKIAEVSDLTTYSDWREINTIFNNEPTVEYLRIGKNRPAEEQALRNLLIDIIQGPGAFGSLIYEADLLINDIYESRKNDISQILDVVVDSDELANRQLQDILAFFGAATPRQVDDTPEGLVKSIEDAPESAKNATKREAPKLTPFDFQCYLLENISKLVDQRGNANYKHVIPVTTDGDPGSIINTIQHGGKTGAVEALLNICPEVYALLVPYLKISRLDYDKFGNVATDGNGRAIMSDLEIPNFLTQDDISDILSGRAGRATGAGIKSFSWSLDGVQPAEVDNNIKATLVMYFQSVNDFFNGASSAGQQTPNFLDLIINSPAVKKLKEKEGDDPEIKSCPDDLIKPELHKGYEGRNYRVKICAGWAVPDKETILELVKDDSKAENLVEAIADSRISLFLQMTQHQISFNQNGSLELTVDYQASLAGLLSGRTADIFDETPKLIKEDIKGQEEIIDNIDDIDESNLTDSDKEKKKAALEEIKELKNIDKNVKYKKLLKNIYSADAIRFISLNPNELSMTPYKDLTPKQRQKRVKRRNNETLEISQVGTINQELIDTIGKDESRDAGEVEKAYSEVATKSFEEMMKQDKIAIPFFYLGDLLDAVIEEIKINNSNNTSDGLKPLNFNFFISDVEMIDPLLAFKAKNLEDLINCGYNLREIEFIESASKETPTKNAELNGIYKTMNIGDIPISLDAFQLWFKNNVVKKGRENYFFLYFVKDVCKEMISRALSSKCFGKEFNFEQRFDTQPLTLAKQETKISNFTPNVLTTAQKISNAKASISCDLDPTQTELGLLLYPTDSNPKDLRGDYTKDVGRGIYHHYLGSSCGLVKTINFNRQDQPYLRESRIQKEGALGAEQLRELYSANIDLVGNTLYRNGMYIYINPSLIGASQEYLDYLGLHGYYLVTAVKSTVTPNSFDVSIEALHEGIEFKGNKLQPSAFDTGDFEGLDPERAPENIVQRELKDFREELQSYYSAIDGTDQSEEARKLKETADNTGATAARAWASGGRPPGS